MAANLQSVGLYSSARGNDTTSPVVVITSITVGDGQITVGYTSDGTGTGRVIAVADGNALPTGTQIMAGTDGDDVAAADDSGDITISSTGAQTPVVLTGLTNYQAYHVFVAVEDAEINIGEAAEMLVVPMPSDSNRGAQAVDGGTTGIIVSPSGNDTTGDGTVGAPYLTVQKAVDVVVAAGPVAGTKILLRTGEYAGEIDLDGFAAASEGNRLYIQPYSTETPVIKGSTSLGSWTQCDASDTILGSIADPSKVWKTTLADSAYPGARPIDLALRENGKMVPPAMVWAHTGDGEKYKWVDNKKQFTADTFTLDGSNYITAITDADVFTTANFGSDAAVTGLYVFVRTNPNEQLILQITSADLSTHTVYVDGAANAAVGYPTSADWKYAVLGSPRHLKRGTFFASSSGGTTTIYCWPFDPNHLASDMAYVAQTYGFDASGSDYATINGLTIRDFWGDGDRITGNGIVKGNGTDTAGFTVENCVFTGIGQVSKSYGVIHMQDANGLVIQNNTALSCNCSGFAMWDSNDTMIRRNIGVHLANAQFNVWSGVKGAVLHNLFRNGGWMPHANIGAIYQSQEYIMLWGNDVEGCRGYLPYNSTSGMLAAFNRHMISFESTDDRRWLFDQTATDASTNPGRDCFIFNNTVVPNSATNGGVSIDPATAAANMVFYVHNNVTGTMASSSGFAGYSLTATEETNIIADLVYEDSNVGTQVAGDFDASDVISSKAGIWDDYTTGDALASGSPVLSTRGTDMTTAIATYESLLAFVPSGDWDLDYDFNTISWDIPFVGADASIDKSAIPAEPDAFTSGQWSVTDAEAATGDEADVTISSLPSANNSAITDIEYQVDSGTWRSSGGTTSFTIDQDLTEDTQSNINIRAVNAIGNGATSDTKTVTPTSGATSPTVLREFATSSAGTQFESTSFTASGNPLILYVFSLNSTAALYTMTATVGTSPRTYGTGTSFGTAENSTRFSQVQCTAFYLGSPGSGTVTVQVESDTTANALAFVVVEDASATGTGATDTDAASATSSTLNVTTTAAGNVFYAWAMRDPTSTLTVSGATELTQGTSGDTNQFQDIRYSVAYEAASGAGSYDATATANNSEYFAGVAVEVNS